MSKGELLTLLSGELFDESHELSLVEMCRTCRMPAERILELVDEGIVEPLGRDPARWRFSAVSVRRVRSVQRLERDLGVNTAGAALALELLEELRELRARVQRLEG